MKRLIASALLLIVLLGTLPTFGGDSVRCCACCRNGRVCHCCNHQKPGSEPSFEDARSGCGKDCACSIHPNSFGLGVDRRVSSAASKSVHRIADATETIFRPSAYLTVSGRAPPLS